MQMHAVFTKRLYGFFPYYFITLFTKVSLYFQNDSVHSNQSITQYCQSSKMHLMPYIIIPDLLV